MPERHVRESGATKTELGCRDRKRSAVLAAFVRASAAGN